MVVRWPPPSVPPVTVDTERPVISSKEMITIIAITNTAPAMIAIHFHGSRASASRHSALPWSPCFSSTSIWRVEAPVRLRFTLAIAAAWTAATRSRLMRIE